MVITDFTPDSADLGWRVVNDNVMGGRSAGGFDIVDSGLQFTGRTNTRGGGFSSIRSQVLNLDLSDYNGIRVRVRGDGRRYTWRLTTDARIYGREVAYWADFETIAGEWADIDIPFDRFIPRFRGSTLDGPALARGRLQGMGLMIYDKRDGPFELMLAQVSAYRNKPDPFSLRALQWQKRVLVISAADPDDDDFIAQRAAITESKTEFDDRDLVLVTLVNTGVSLADDRTLSTGDVSSLRKALAITGKGFAVRLIGKDGSVKLANDSVVSMAELYALIDRMPMRRQELRDR
ncbi:MAG: CIA30 family protein [Pseudomonadota bacterium]